MGLIADAIRNVFNPQVPTSIAGPMWRGDAAGGPQSYLEFARRGYMGNEIVFSAIELIATSAAEPHIAGRRRRRESPAIRAETMHLRAAGCPLIQINNALVRNGFVIQVPEHPLVKLLNAPNPFMSRGQCWSTVVMDRYLGGNAYLLKARYQDGILAGAVGELWRLRPDRVRIIPDSVTFCKYEYTVPGLKPVVFEYKDVMHFKTRNPLDDYYGMPPLLTISKRIDIDNYMAGFLRTFFDQGGSGPGSILTVKGKLSEEAKKEIKDRFKRQFGGSGGAHEMLILDTTESTYQHMGLNRGLRDALPKELDAMSEARIAMVFGIPGSILGLLIGYESSSYANKRADETTFWKITMTPLLSDLDDVLNLSMVPEFAGIDEVYFDLSDIEALQPDVKEFQERHRQNFAVGGESFEEFRDAVGLDPKPTTGTFFVPSNMVPTPVDELDAPPPPPPAPPPPPQLAPPEPGPEAVVDVITEARCPHCNRLLGRDVSGARFDCPRCKMPVIVENGVMK